MSGPRVDLARRRSGVWLAVAVSVVGGTALGVLGMVSASTAVAAAIAAVSGVLVVGRGRVVIVLGLVAVVAAAAVNGRAARAGALTPSLLEWFEEAGGGRDRLDEPVQIAGRLAGDASPGLAGVRLRVDVVSVRDAHGWHAASGTVQLTVAGEPRGDALEHWTEGRRFRGPVLFRRPRAWRNPGMSSAATQSLRRSFALAGTVKSGLLVEVQPASWRYEQAAAIRRWVRQRVQEFISPLGDQSAAIVNAILIGDRAGLDPAVQARLQAAGTYHVIAISGGNVALVTAVCLLGLRLAVRSARLSVTATLLAVVSYGWIVGGDASVARAVTAAAIYLGVSLVGLVPRPLHVIALVASLIAVFDPLAVLDVGAWLSFGATTGIVVGAGRALSWVSAWTGDGRGWIGWVGRGALVVATATLAAELALLPVTATVFSRVGVAGLVVNLVAVPAMALVQAAGALTVVLATMSTWAAWLAASAAHLAAVALTDSARLVDVAPWLAWRVPAVSPWWAVAYYAAWAMWLGARPRSPVRWTASAIVMASAAVIAIGPSRALHSGQLRLTAIDVGQGDALLVEFPNGQSMLVDTGGAGPGFDIGARVVVPAVWASGVRRLDWLVITHGDLDHIGGAMSVVRDLRPREIWEGTPVPPNAELRALRRAAAEAGVVWRSLGRGYRRRVGGVEVDVRHPRPPDWERQRVRNDDSLVIGLAFRDVEFLLTGDAGAEFEEEVERGPSERRLRVLKVAHHGSRSSSSEPFIASYRPAIALVSAGQANLFGHPAPEIVERLVASRAAIYRTDRDGAITVATDGQTIRTTTHSGRDRSVVVWPRKQFSFP